MMRNNSSACVFVLALAVRLSGTAIPCSNGEFVSPYWRVTSCQLLSLSLSLSLSPPPPLSLSHSLSLGNSASSTLELVFSRGRRFEGNFFNLSLLAERSQRKTICSFSNSSAVRAGITQVSWIGIFLGEAWRILQLVGLAC